MDIDEAIDAAEALADYALLQKISLPAGVEQTLRSARGRKAQYLAPGIPRNDFFAAVGAAQVAISLSPAALLSAQARRHRLQPIVADAQALLGYAAANAHKIDDTTRQVLIAKADAIERGIPTVEDEQAFFKAYEQLTVATAPVTAETLIASNTVLPSLAEFFSKKDFSKSFEKLTLGRFADAIVFILVLLLTGVILGYHSQGSQGLSRVRELDTSIAKLAADVATNADAMDQREQTLRAAVGRNPPVQEQIDAAQKAVSESRRLLASAKQQLEQSTSERSELPVALWTWTHAPCNYKLTAWVVCSSTNAAAKEGSVSQISQIRAAETATRWLNEIVLPLLLGWLGAYAFIIRRMTDEISKRSFEKSSALRHITRLALGALAGIASSWLLTGGTVSAEFKSVPAWVLAFVAGYGIELVFAFLDRIISAFTSKKS